MKLVLALLLLVVVSTIVPVFASAPALQAQRNYALYTVRSGDTLVSIAQRYNISSQRLADFNALEGALIHPGDLLKVPYLEGRGGVAEPPPAPPPGFRVHRLASGETISAVLSNYGVSLEALIGANPDLSSLDRLPEGSELFIPPAHLPEGMLVALEPEQSLLDILDIYGVHPVALARANNIRDPLALREGQLLFLPGVPPVHALDRLEAVRTREHEELQALRAVRLAAAEEAARLAALEELRRNRYDWPIHGRLTSYFGPRRLGRGTANFHAGIDIAAPHGAPIRAARPGTVSFAGWSSRGYGYLVRIRHYGGAETWYAHASEILVRVGQEVARGDIIARIGSTGISTGPHLHFELHENGRPINPMTHLH